MRFVALRLSPQSDLQPQQCPARHGWVFSSTHSTNARSWGSEVQPATSRTLARTTDPWTNSTNPVCAEPVRTPATLATPSTATTPDARPSTASTSAWHRRVPSPRWPRSAPRSDRRPPLAAGPDAAHRPTRPDVTRRTGYATAEPFRSPDPGVGKAPCSNRHRRLPTRFVPASPTPPRLFVAVPTPPTRHAHQRSMRSQRHAEWAHPSLTTRLELMTQGTSLDFACGPVGAVDAGAGRW